MNKHQAADLKMMQSLPLESKIAMTKQRIETWYRTWKRYEIFDEETGKTRYVTAAIDSTWEEPPMKPSEYVKWVWDGQVYVSFSGGKDSTVLKHIVDSMYDDVPALFVNTGLEYPEIQKFAMSQKNVIAVRPEMRFDEVLRKYGYPVIGKRQADAIELGRKNIEQRKYTVRLRNLGITPMEALKAGFSLPSEEMLARYEGSVNGSKYAIPQHRRLLYADFPVSAKCCDVMKKRPAFKFQKETGRKPILATMAQESMIREAAWYKNGCNAFDSKHPSSQPMAFWTEQDVLQYIKKYNVPYCSVYGDIRVKQTIDNDNVFDGQMNMIDYLGCYEPEDKLETTGCDRTGCIFCMFGCQTEKAPNRFQRLKQTHPRQYDYCINGGEMVDGKWQPNKDGLGLGHVLDYIGVKYD